MTAKKKHPWKICDAGSYFVKSHYKNINGKKFLWNAHCRKGIGTKETLNFDEIYEISKNFNSFNLTMPKPYDFNVPKGFGNKYDIFIAGWVKYWSDIFGSHSKIDTAFVKTLIMTESSFQPKATAVTHNIPGEAIGLMQITDYTFKLIQQNEKELRNHVFDLKRKDLFDPNVNICVGVRWLFRKREIAKYFLKKEPSSLELAEEYKGIRNDQSIMAKKQRENFKKYFKEYIDAKIKK